MKATIVLYNDEKLTCTSCNDTINKGLAKNNIAHLTVDDKTRKVTDIKCHNCATGK